MNRNVLLMPHLCLYLHKDSQQDVGSGSEKKWYSTYDSKPQGERDRVGELMMM